MKISRRQALTIGGLGLVGVGAYGLSRVTGAGSALIDDARSRARPIRTDTTPLPQADVVVIGGGDIGAATAYYLAKRGMAVTLCEKGAVGAEASGRSVGHVFGLGAEERAFPLTLAAKALWPGINEELQIETGYRQNGCLIEIVGEGDRAYWESWIKDNGVSSARILDTKELASSIETYTPWRAAIYDHTDGSAEPTLVAPAFAEAAQRLGAHVVAPCAVRGLEFAAGRVAGVVTERGTIRTNIVVLAGGAWSTPFMESLGLRLPIGNLFSWCASFGADNGPMVNSIFAKTTWRRQLDGGFTTSLMSATVPITPASVRYARELSAAMEVGNADWDVRPRLGRWFFEELFTPTRWRLDQVSPFERRRILVPEVDHSVVEHALYLMRTNVPAFKDLIVKDSWGGVLACTPDTLPVISPIDRIPGLIAATGFSDGLSLTPGVGKAVAEIVHGESPMLDLSPFRYGRFG